MPDPAAAPDRDARIRALLELRDRLAARGGIPAEGGGAHPAWLAAGTPDEPFPLTDLQQSHFVSRHMPEADPVGCHTYLEFTVPALDADRLERVWRRLVEVHPMLRARVDRDATQRIVDAVPLALPRYRMERADPAVLERHLAQVRSEMSHRVYHPGEWPLWDVRVTLLPSGAGRVHVGMDAWIMDGASAALLHRQWSWLYHDHVADLEAPMATFRDFVLSMHAFQGTAAHRRCLDYWVQKLTEAPPGPALPVLDGVERAATGERRRLVWSCTPEIWRALRARAAEAGVSPSVALLGVFAEHGQAAGWGSRFSLVMTVRNRPLLHPGIEEVVGPFSSTAVFVFDPPGDGGFASRLRAYQRQVARDLEHGYVSGVAALRLVAGAAAARPPRVVLTSAVGARQGDGGGWLEEVDYAVSQTPGVDLHLHAEERGGTLHLACDFAHRRLDGGAVETLFGDVCLALEQFSAAGADGEGDPVAGTVRERRRRALDGAGGEPGRFSLTPLQRAMIAARLADPGPGVATVYREFDVPAAALERLQQAVTAIVDGSETLRSVLLPARGARVELSAAWLPVPVGDLRGCDRAAVEAELKAARTGMEASVLASPAWPPLHVRGWRLDGGRGRVQVLLDMAVFDGWSTWAFYHDLLGRCADAEAALALPGRMDRYTAARDHHVASLAGAADRVYWAGKLATLPPGPRWPWSAGAGPARWRRDAWVFAEWFVVRAAAESCGVQAEALLAVLYGEALRRVARLPALTLTIASYPDRAGEQALAAGYGDATALAWVPFASDPAATLADRARAVAAELARDGMHGWGDPFAVLRHAAAEGPRFSAALTLCLGAPLQWPGDVTEVRAAARTPGIDADQMVAEVPGGLRVAWELRGDRIPAPAAQALVDTHRAMLLALAATPAAWEQPLAALAAAPGVHGPECPVPFPWNHTDAEYDREQTLHGLFERQAARAPDRVAVVADEETLTYAELECRANRLARYLHARGVRPGERVGVLLDRTAGMVAALLGILKAGAAYVPLGPGDPPLRLAAMARRAEIRTFVTVAPHAPRLNGSARAVLLDGEAAAIAAEVAAPPPLPGASSAGLAYVIFTSGSTGEPKGVAVQHRPVVNLLEWAARACGFGPDDRVLFVSPLGFDLSVFDVFGMLAYGGSVRVVGEADRLDPARLAAMLIHEPITFWNSAPAYLQYVLPLVRPRAAEAVRAALRLTFLSGDWVPTTLPDELRALFPSARVTVLGGATEAAVWSNWFPVGEVDPAWGSIPYGQPIQNARYYLLDDLLHPVVAGAAGRLYIGGECLASGYIHAPRLTASRFLPDPFHERPGMRMYDTGDLARDRGDGTMEFLGRADHQVKLRGFRVELGEVEAALAAAGIDSPVAVVREETPGSRVIAGFGRAQGAPGMVEHDGTWRMLRERLPEYMLPFHVHVLAALPLTPNGKVDRRRLAEAPLAELLAATAAGPPDAPDPPAPATPEPPAPDAGALAVWIGAALARILGREAGRLEPETHFSTLAVNSLHFALLAGAIAEEAGVAVSPARLFRCGTVAEIADEVTPLLAARTRSPAGVPAAGADSPSVVSLPAGGLHSGGAEPAGAGGAGERGHHSAAGASSSAGPVSADGALSHPMQETPAPGRREVRGAVQELAVIGLHCVMPQADDAERFWANLLAGRDCVEAIPGERWSWRALADPAHGHATAVNRGAFIRDVDRFDAGFFSISPREAELMDPRQRLLLQGVWKTLEDAGLRPSSLRGRSVGVFLGATGDEYGALLQQAGAPADPFSLTGAGRSFLANRLSYHFGWHGPSEVVDATCASSLAAVHNAARALASGDCEMAVAGGINVMIDPWPHVILSRLGVLSPDGACRAFDADANGYVRGEGVGLVLLKPLHRALADGDFIHAVLAGTAVNHGGRANALTAPNPRAQARVIVAAHLSSGVHPRQVGYVEAHGTGTVLGDPIEVGGLKEAFTTLFAAHGEPLPHEKRISVGSVKTSVGHLEAAAGISGLIKAVLMLRARTIPPVVHLRRLNPQVEADGTPFRFDQAPRPWPAPLDGEGRPLPRAAGVSAFGIGGVNVHVVLREQVATPAGAPTADLRVVVPLSARTAARLEVLARSLADAVRAGVAPGDVAFTLATGRESFAERAVVLADTGVELADRLDALGEGRTAPGVIRGSARGGGASGHAGADDPEACAREWVRGAEVDWTRFSGGGRRVPLPSSPFERVRHWASTLDRRTLAATLPSLADMDGGGFRVVLTGDEPWIEHHRLAGVRVVPAAVTLALATDAARRLCRGVPAAIADLAWIRPIRFGDERVQVLRFEAAPRGAGYLLRLLGDGEEGAAEYLSARVEPVGAPEHPPRADLTSLRRHCTEVRGGESCYGRLAAYGVDLGPSLRVIHTFAWGERDGLAHLVLPDGGLLGGAGPHPALVDGAFQAALLHHLAVADTPHPHLPFAALASRAFGPFPAECWVHVRRTEGTGARPLPRYDLSVYAPDGEPLLRIEGSIGVPSPAGLVPRRPEGMRLFRERWQPVADVHSFGAEVDEAAHVTFGLPELADALHAATERVLAHVVIPGASEAPGHGSAVPWDALAAGTGGDLPRTVVLWYDERRFAALGMSEQLQFGFDTVAALVRRLAARRGAARVVVCALSPSGRMLAPTLDALAGSGRVAHDEAPGLLVKLVRFAGWPEPSAEGCRPLLAALAAVLRSGAARVEHRFDLDAGTWFEPVLEPDDGIIPSAVLPVARGATYLVSGGLGGIGQHVARALVEQGARVALLGRARAEEAEPVLAALGPPGRVRYWQADVTNEVAVEAAVAAARAALRDLRGVFHCAGEPGGGLLRMRSPEDSRRVIAPQVQGAAVLDRVTRADPLDLFVFFSSLASVTGPAGAGDYAFAARYAARFAEHREELGRRGLRRGRTLAVSWPMWEDGGMRLPVQELEYLRRKGLEPIGSALATRVLGGCLAASGGHVLCAFGERELYEPYLRACYAPDADPPPTVVDTVASRASDDLRLVPA